MQQIAGQILGQKKNLLNQSLFLKACNSHISCLKKFMLLTCLIILLFSCYRKKEINSPLFKALDSDFTGLHFSNKLTPTTQFNLFSYMYYYNGAGVGAGDFNNDGLIDLFFSANQQQNQLYINKGRLKFEDRTTLAQIPQDSGWSTGVSIVDINNDGLLDIYVCKVGHFKTLNSSNQLLICKGINKDGTPFYEDQAQIYGLNFKGFSTQSVFFDYDGDGDLDMFLLNHSVNHDGNYAPRKNFLNTYDSLAGQRLYRNETFNNSNGKPVTKFVDVTSQTGINGSRIGYGLGVAVADVNLDGWPDFYVGNDFHENDYLYINQKNGTFKEEGSTALMHTSQFTMGVDIADINNDAYPEIISMDMLPSDPYILRRSLTEDDYTIFQQKIDYGYNYQYSRNNLQLNRRNGFYSEIGQYAGVYATDWSWAALWLDFDNDGKKDLFVSNGIPKRMNDIDYINYVSNDDVQEKLKNNNIEDKDMSLINKFPEIKIPNQFFKNDGKLFFQDVTDSIKNNKPTFSNGSVYADLDNDGDLDIVVNNINESVLIYANTANDLNEKPSATIQLKGPSNNINAIGAKVVLFCKQEIRTYENNPVHGFQSSMQIPVQFGVDTAAIDSIIIIWPDNTYQSIEIETGKRTGITYTPHLPKYDYSKMSFYTNKTKFVKDITANTGINYRHVENRFDEFNREPLIPHMISTEGPALAVADINHDGLDDIFIGASKTFHNAIFIQTANGNFLKKEQPEMLKDSMWENVNAIWADINNDKNPDLIVASGGNEYYGNDRHLLPLVYTNDGNGNLTRKSDAFSNIFVTQSVVVADDFNDDGYPDLFIGGRAQPWDYGEIPRSYLLQNDGTGKFTDVTAQFCKDLTYPGMITSALFYDLNSDGKKDLITCCEWGGIDGFIRTSSGFTKKVLSDEKGWWNSLLIYDVDHDGNADVIAGNLGLNNKLKASQKQPVSLYHNDFDINGKNEQIMMYYIKGNPIPFSTKQNLEKQLPYLKKQFLYAKDFADADLNKLFGEEKIKNADRLIANNFSNSLFLNKGNFKFLQHPLPMEAQFSSLRGAAIVNANDDSLPDVLMMGNYYDESVDIGRNDSDFGSILINKGNGNFECQPLNGLTIKGQVRHIQPIKITGNDAFILAKNNDSVAVIQFLNKTN
jgi:hypothetical protein